MPFLWQLMVGNKWKEKKQIYKYNGRKLKTVEEKRNIGNFDEGTKSCLEIFSPGYPGNDWVKVYGIKIIGFSQ